MSLEFDNSKPYGYSIIDGNKRYHVLWQCTHCHHIFGARTYHCHICSSDEIIPIKSNLIEHL